MQDVINRCFGIDLNLLDLEDDTVLRFLRALCIDAGEFSGEEIFTWDAKELMAYVHESGEVAEIYSGRLEEPKILGVRCQGFLSTDLNGSDGLIAWAQKTEPTNEDLARFADSIDESTIGIMNTFGFKPKILWVTSTT